MSGSDVIQGAGAPPLPRAASRVLWPLAVGAAIGAFATLAPINDVLGWTATLVAAMVIGLVAWRQPTLRVPLLIGFALRVSAVLVHQYVMPLPGSDADARTYDI